jgi:hypothetical protein
LHFKSALDIAGRHALGPALNEQAKKPSVRQAWRLALVGLGVKDASVLLI